MGHRKGTLESPHKSKQVYLAEKILGRSVDKWLGIPQQLCSLPPTPSEFTAPTTTTPLHPRPWGRLELQSGKAMRLLHILSQGLCLGPRPRAEMLTHSLGGRLAALTSPALLGGTRERSAASGGCGGVEGCGKSVWRALGATAKTWSPGIRMLG